MLVTYSTNAMSPEPRTLMAVGPSALVTAPTAFGFNITVHPAYAGKFQKFFALLKERGYNVPANITKCWRPYGGFKSPTSVRPAISRRVGIAGPSSFYHMGDIVKKAGLYNGCSFHDCGHVEAIRGTTTEHPISTPQWKNSNRSNPRQTINHKHLQGRFDLLRHT
jgi:hypothetical protein